MRTLALFLISGFFTFAGVMHFVKPEPFVAIVPKWMPGAYALVYVSGVFEILGGIGALVPQTRAYAGLGLAALLIAVFPANVYMALHQIPFGDKPMPPVALVVRLFLQPVLLAWVLWTTQDPPLRHFKPLCLVMIAVAVVTAIVDRSGLLRP
jgi:uncharacterized membrane protein